MFGGNVTGTFTELQPYDTIKEAWRFKHWPEGMYSEVTIALKNKDGQTQLTLNQTGVPESDYEMTMVSGAKAKKEHSEKYTNLLSPPPPSGRLAPAAV